MRYPVRVLPWWSDEATRFLSNLMKWYPGYLGRRVTAFEVGSGNSSMYWLSKGVQVTSVETDEGYIEHVRGLASSSGFTVRVVDAVPSGPSDYDLTIIRCPAWDQGVKLGHWYNALGMDNAELNYDFLAIDGVDRLQFLNKFSTIKDAIIILDNCEYGANWGRLTKSSAKKAVSAGYRDFFRRSDWNRIMFEQAEGRDGRPAADSMGWEARHRWLTSISWHDDSPLTKMVVSNLGFPLVNPQGIDDADLETVEDRVPFDWENMKWGTDEEFPEALDLGLERGYD